MLIQYFDINRFHDKEYLRSRFRELAKQHHPDRTRDHDEEVMKQVNAEYAIMQEAQAASEFIRNINFLSRLDHFATVGAVAMLKWSLEHPYTPAMVTRMILLFIKTQIEISEKSRRCQKS